MNWDKNARRQLREALTRQDPRARLADVLCENAGVDVSRVEFTNSGETTWYSVVEEARKGDNLGALVVAAAERWPKEPTLKRLSEEIAPAAASTPNSSKTEATALAVGAGMVVEAMADRGRDPLERVLNGLQIADAAGWLKSYQAMMGRVGLVQVGSNGSGTGFLIGPDLLLTNWHVVANVDDTLAREVVVRFDYWRSPAGLVETTVDVKLAAVWLCDKSPWSKVDLELAPTSLPGVEELDFAVLRLERTVGREDKGGTPRGWIPLPEEYSLTTGQSVLILQHPSGHPLRMAFDGVLQVNANKTRVRYQTNTLPGSSGSPCFDQNWTLIALHHSGDPQLNPTYNEGIPAPTIRKLLEARGKVTLEPWPD